MPSRSCGTARKKLSNWSKKVLRSARSLCTGAYIATQVYSSWFMDTCIPKMRGLAVWNFRPPSSQAFLVGQSTRNPTLYHWIKANSSMYSTWGLQVSGSLQSSSQKCSSDNIAMAQCLSRAVWIKERSLCACAVKRQFKPWVIQTDCLDKRLCLSRRSIWIPNSSYPSSTSRKLCCTNHRPSRAVR